MEESYERLLLYGIPKHKNVIEVVGISDKMGLLLKAHTGGSLLEYNRSKKGHVSILALLNLSLQMSEAVAHIHLHGVVHRDLAQRNYVLSEDLQILVLIDFGLAYPLQDEDFVEIQTDELMPYKQCPPETLNLLSYYRASDVWQLGVAFWQFLHARQPFFAYTCPQLKSLLNIKMCDKGGSIPLSFKRSQTEPAFINTLKEIVYFCCIFDHPKRPSAPDVVQKIKTMIEAVETESQGIEEAEVYGDEKVAEYQPEQAAIDESLRAYGGTDYQRLGDHYIDLHAFAKSATEIKDDADELVGAGGVGTGDGGVGAGDGGAGYGGTGEGEAGDSCAGEGGSGDGTHGGGAGEGGAGDDVYDGGKGDVSSKECSAGDAHEYDKLAQ